MTNSELIFLSNYFKEFLRILLTQTLQVVLEIHGNLKDKFFSTISGTLTQKN